MKKQLQFISLKKIIAGTMFLSMFNLNLKAQAIPELLYYKFDSTGTSVPNNALTPPSGTTYATLMGGLTQGSTGQCKGAVIGSGIASSTDYVNTGYATNLTGSSWTISMWTSNITPSATLFYIFGDVTAGSFRCFTNGVAGANNWILRGTFTDVLVTGGATVAPHVTTFVYDVSLGNIKAYLDGVLVNTVAQGAVTINGTGPFKVIGYSSNVGCPAGGLLDEFRMYNRALSAAEVLELATPPNTYSTLNLTNCNSYTVPSGTATYTTSGTYMDTIPAIGGCADSIMTINLTVNPLPVVVANADNDTICAGSNVTLTGSGAVSYAWDNSVSDGIAFSPAASGSYIVTGTDANFCQNNDTIEVVVNSLPIVIANADNDTICAGVNVTLSGNGAVSYVWNNSVIDGLAFSPAASGSYIVTGTDANFCQNNDTIEVVVNLLPPVAANSTGFVLCEGDSTSLYGTGAVSYVWTGGITDGVNFLPLSTGTYTVTGTDINGCQNTDFAQITVNTLPSVSLSLSQNFACLSDAAFALTGENPSGGTYSGTAVSAGSFDPSVAGAGVFAITYSYTDINSCINSAVDSITIDVCLNSKQDIEAGNFSVYPNPSTGKFVIMMNTASATTLIAEISNQLGQIVYSIKFTGSMYQADLSEMANGIYNVRIVNGSEIVTKRLIKN